MEVEVVVGRPNAIHLKDPGVAKRPEKTTFPGDAMGADRLPAKPARIFEI